MPSQNNSEGRNRLLFRYAGMATQFLVATGIAVFLGIKADRWLGLSFPVFVWLLPLMVIAGIIIKVIRDTSKD